MQSKFFKTRFRWQELNLGDWTRPFQSVLATLRVCHASAGAPFVESTWNFQDLFNTSRFSERVHEKDLENWTVTILHQTKMQKIIITFTVTSRPAIEWPNKHLYRSLFQRFIYLNICSHRHTHCPPLGKSDACPRARAFRAERGKLDYEVSARVDNLE